MNPPPHLVILWLSISLVWILHDDEWLLLCWGWSLQRTKSLKSRLINGFENLLVFSEKVALNHGLRLLTPWPLGHSLPNSDYSPLLLFSTNNLHSPSSHCHKQNMRTILVINIKEGCVKNAFDLTYNKIFSMNIC